MNKAGRALLSKMAEELDDIRTRLEELKDAEQGKVDNIPDALQGTEKAEALESAAYALQEAHDNLENLVADLQTIIEGGL